ncbi:phosphate transport system permease protein [Microlunatus endophyticus]|uniref:Phosphate transport system permease protein n=1 Tax=Microlunatus endophyticus TaxID=1716077 RepID=A0A917S5B8_9ACTN|nr:phosphate ABC transporter permease subunit PstC [Microlunatus endophyticus]GGL58181.1 phosphate transport system permease protein [Microlunatus endophyticus]
MSVTRERPPIVEEPGSDPFVASSRRRRAIGDRIFSSTALAAGLTILIALAAVFIFLISQGARGFHADPEVYQPAANNFFSYAAKLLFGTALSSLLAMIIAVPFAIGLALFISHYAPRRIAVPVAYVIDILAAVPSVIYGLWGARTLAPASHGLQTWLNAHLGWIPLFGGQISATGRTMLIAAIVLAIMVLPISTAICREVFQRTPKLLEEAALGLGATRWEMIRYAVFPHARSGMVAGMMLGLGRALGETMAVAMVLSASPQVTFKLLTSDNPATIASNIAANYQAEDVRIQTVLIATGLVLFVFTFLVNFVARAIVARSERRFA